MHKVVQLERLVMRSYHLSLKLAILILALNAGNGVAGIIINNHYGSLKQVDVWFVQHL